MTDYASVNDFKSWVTARGATASDDSADDLVIQRILESVSRHIEEQTGRRFWKNSTAETRYFPAIEAYRLEVPDLVSITTLSVDYSNTRVYTDFVAADFELSPPNAALDGKPYDLIEISPNSSAYFPVFDLGGSRSVKILGVFGWPSIPGNIVSACLSITHNVWMGRSGQTGSGRVTVTASGVVIRPEDVPPMVQQDLLSYRNYR